MLLHTHMAGHSQIQPRQMCLKNELCCSIAIHPRLKRMVVFMPRTANFFSFSLLEHQQLDNSQYIAVIPREFCWQLN